LNPAVRAATMAAPSLPDRGFAVTAKTSRGRHRAAAIACALALATAACGTSEAVDGTADPQASVSTTTAPPTTETTTAPPSSSPPAATGTTVTTGDSEFGVMLFDDRNQAIYLFDAETDPTPACYDECAADWPPVLTDGTPQAAGALRGDLLGTTQRSDGTMQVTYCGHPLYFYAHEGPGEVLCHDVDDYGGTWLVVTPEGTPAPT
jgi:predicted lipoprotein with Yx(FWY)xxD motif